jgi:DNA repair exonuclease SbcCD ATPase subunit
MNLCSSKHDEICYEGRECPVCELIKEHVKEIQELNSRIDELRNELTIKNDE